MGTLRHIRVRLGTFRYFWVLLGTSWNIEVLLGTFLYFEVLQGTLCYFWVLSGTSGYFEVKNWQNWLKSSGSVLLCFCTSGFFDVSQKKCSKVQVKEFSDCSGVPWNSIIGSDMPSALGLV